ncbi:uncharacterized protein LOC128337707 isoform X2 [Hemicordylus capensis]|uniref:uncharacterized protein LOC128337707 isoform X2 n=1 Tax=Hemicordylus capensis TaxID=884348 RepID=UPI0023045EB2|nr:uncharacterized protein LOC128337707 isoform X2 [Hemicordylus capensis]
MDTSDYDSADDFILTQRSNSPMYEPLTPLPSEEEEEPGLVARAEAEAHRAQSKPNTSAGSVKRKQLFEVKQVPEEVPEILITDEDLTGKPKVSEKQGQPSAKGCNGEPGTSEGGGRVKRALKRRHLGLPRERDISEGAPPMKKSKKQEHEESELAGDAVQQSPDQAQVTKFAKELIEAGEHLTQLSRKITENENIITEKQKIVTRFKQYQSYITEFLEGDVRRYNLPGMADFLKDIKNELMYPYSITRCATLWGGGRTLNSDTQTDSDSVQSTETEAETLPETQNTVDSVVSYHSDTDDGEGGDVYLDPIRNWERLNNRYRAREMYFEFRFVNLHRARSYHEAIAGIHTAIQSLLDTVNGVIGPNDYVQLRLQGDRLNNPLFTVRRNRNELSAEEYLTAISNLLQSYAEILGDDTLRLNVVIVNPPEGGARRSIMTIPYSSIIERKQQHLIDAHIQGTNLCFAGGVLTLLSNSPTLEQIIVDAEKMHMDLGWSPQKKVSLPDVSAVEQYLQVKIPGVHWNGTKWGIFKTDEQNYTDTCYMLLYNDHYYGIKNISGFFGSRNFCQICSTPYSHTHDCMYTCRRCLRKECPKKVGRIHRCPTCKLQCRSKACLTIHEKLASEEKVDCTLRILCSKCDHYVDLNHESKMVCQGKQCRTYYCYLGKIKQPKLSIRYVFYDCECRQESGIHIPNLIVAKAFKEETVKSVPKKKWKPAGESWEFKGDTCLKDFIQTFTSDLSFKKTHFICHNFWGYDAYLILGGILKEKFDVDLITQGGNVIYQWPW